MAQPNLRIAVVAPALLALPTIFSAPFLAYHRSRLRRRRKQQRARCLGLRRTSAGILSLAKRPAKYFVDPQMATRQNKKRKGRNNAPPRERTVTTLTDGTDGPFMSSPVDDHTSASLMSPPFSVNVNTPISAAAQPPGISPAPFPIPPFSSPFSSYSFAHMPPVAPSIGGPFQQPPHFYSPAAMPGFNHSQQQQHPSTVLPPGQNDLEILERLKETIKNNHHELYRPIPQPAALASVYLGPKSSSAPSQVPPHPEQVPTDPSPPGLTLVAQDAPKLPADAAPAQSAVSPVVPPAVVKDATRKPPHRTSVSESPKPSVLFISHRRILCKSLIYLSFVGSIPCEAAGFHTECCPSPASEQDR